MGAVNDTQSTLARRTPTVWLAIDLVMLVSLFSPVLLIMSVLSSFTNSSEGHDGWNDDVNKKSNEQKPCDAATALHGSLIRMRLC
jgi:hypothetical protein